MKRLVKNEKRKKKRGVVLALQRRSARGTFGRDIRARRTPRQLIQRKREQTDSFARRNARMFSWKGIKGKTVPATYIISGRWTKTASREKLL